VSKLVPEDLKGALKFVRGRVHHRWGDAVEFRDDVLLPPVPLGWQAGRIVTFIHPTVYADWCWRPVAELPKGRPGGQEERNYEALLAGKQVKSKLTPFTDLVYNVTYLETHEVLATPS